MALAETRSVKDGLASGNLGGHTQPFLLFWFVRVLVFSFPLSSYVFCFFALRWMVEPSLVSSTLGFQCTRPRWPLWGFCGSRNNFLKEKRKYKGFSFVLSASRLRKPRVWILSDRHSRSKNMYPVRWGLRTPLSSLQFPPSLKESGFHPG